MGTTECSFCTSEKQDVGPTVTIKHRYWSNAVNKQVITGIKQLHAEDPDLINEYVTENGMGAIHMAIILKNKEMLEYLLSNGANVNMVGGRDANTALHEAVLAEDIPSIRLLFTYNADETILNRKKKTAEELCVARFKRPYSNAKNNLESALDNKYLRDTTEITVAGITLDGSNTTEIRSYDRSLREPKLDWMQKKQLEITDRCGYCITCFGDQLGIDVDEIAHTFAKLSDKERERLWDKFVKDNASKIQKISDIYKVVYGVILFAMKQKFKNKGRAAMKNSKQVIRDLTTRICKLLPRSRKKAMLSKKYFIHGFHRLLFRVHIEMKGLEEDDKKI